MDLIPMPSALLSCLLLFPLRGQESRQKQVGIGHRGRRPFNKMKSFAAILLILANSVIAGEQIPQFLSKSESKKYVQIGRSGTQPSIVRQAEFVNLVKDNHTILLDTRNSEYYDKKHVKNAISLPFLQLDKKVLEEIIPRKDTTILIYTPDNFRRRPSDPVSTTRPSWIFQVFAVLTIHGYTDVLGVDPNIHFPSIPQLLVPTD